MADTMGTKIGYISTSGGAYINTGFTPTYKTKIIMEYELTAGSTATAAFWGCRSSSSSTIADSFTCWSISGTKYRIDFLSQAKTIQAEPTGKHIISMEPGKFVLDGVVTSITQTTNNGYGNLYIACVNTNGTADTRIANINIYSCQIYENGTLVRNFIPGKDGSSYYLFDTVQSKRYGSANSVALSGGGTAAKVNDLYIYNASTNAFLKYDAYVYKDGSWVRFDEYTYL